MPVSPEEAIAELKHLPFEMTWDVEDLGSSIRRVWIEDPHGVGVGIDLIWTGTEVAATLGQGVVVDFPFGFSIEDLVELLTVLMGQPSIERWSRSKNVLEFGSPAGSRKFASSRSGPRFARDETKIRRYGSYRQVPA